jgi:tetratricopeptide (TPR) repeat protein
MSKSFLLPIIPSLAYLILCLNGSLAAPGSLSDKDRGIQEYNLGNYFDASESFQSSISLWPEDAATHYYLANCFAHLNRLDDAVQEYENAFQLAKGKNARLASYCSTGMATCKSVLLNSKGAAGLKPPLQIQKENDVATAVQKIKDEAEVQKNICAKDADSIAQSRLAGGQYKVDAIKAERDYRIDYMRHAGLTDSRGRFYPLYTQEDIDLAYRSYDEGLIDTAAAANARAELVRSHGRSVAKELDNVAASLEDQLKDLQNSRGPKLLPIGTNLYIRNYSLLGTPSTNATEQPELTATEEKLIVDKHQRFVWPNRTVAGRGTQANDSSRTTTGDVYGRLLQAK